jgi:hypothetical protein
MSGHTGRSISLRPAASGPQARSAGPASAPAAAPGRATKVLGWSALAAIAVSILIIIAAAIDGNGWNIPRLIVHGGGPPWGLSIHVSLSLVAIGLWIAAILGGIGVVAGLTAVAHGMRFPVWLLLAAALVAVTLLAVVRPAGSTDTFDYAAYGRMAVLGHSPYLMTPVKLRAAGDPIGKIAARYWGRRVSVYGPLATAEQWAAAELGGTSILRIVFWLKVWNAVAFGVVALALDRLLCVDPGRRLRAHLLWTVNPLLLWALVEGGHVDAVAAAAGVLAIAVLGMPWTARGPGLGPALAAGVLVGLATDIKVTFVLFGLGIAWAARRSPAAVATAAAGAVLAIVPGYLWFGHAAVRAIIRKSYADSSYDFYRAFHRFTRHPVPDRTELAILAFVVLAVLVLWRLPDGLPEMPAVQPALALSIAFLFVWPYQFPWYETLALCLLALYPASRLDWLVMARLTAGTVAMMPGNTGGRAWHPHVLATFHYASYAVIAPTVLLTAVLGLVWLCLSGAWHMGPPLARPVTGPRALA